MTFTILPILIAALVLPTALAQSFTDIETPGMETQAIKTSGNYVVRMPSITNHPDTDYPRVRFSCSFKGDDSNLMSLNIDHAYKNFELERMFPSLQSGQTYSFSLRYTVGTGEEALQYGPETWEYLDNGKDERLRHALPITLIDALGNGRVAGAESLTIQFQTEGLAAKTYEFYIGELELCLMGKACRFDTLIYAACGTSTTEMDQLSNLIRDIKAVVAAYGPQIQELGHS